MPLDSIAVFSILDRVTDDNGDPIPGALVEFYQAGTSTPLTVYSDYGLTTALGTSIVCDSGGFPTSDGTARVVVYTGTQAYKVIVKGPEGNVLSTYDNIKGAPTVPELEASARPITPVISKTTNYQILASDGGALISANPTGGAFALTLPDATDAGDGWRIGVRHSGTVNAVTVRTTSAQTISTSGTNTATALALTGLGQSYWFVCNGSGWLVESETPALVSGNMPYLEIADRMTEPPSTPAGGTRYLINGTPSGIWFTNGYVEHDIVEANGNGGWIRYAPRDGWLAYVLDENLLTQYRDTTWVDLTGVTPPGESALGHMLVEHREANGVTGGSSTASAWTNRPLNTEIYNTIDGALFSAPGLTLPVGNYLVSCEQHLYAEIGTLGGTTFAQQQVAAGTAVLAASPLGVGSRMGGTASGSGVVFSEVHSHILRDTFLIEVTTAGTVTLQYFVTYAQASNGMGYPSTEPTVGFESYARVSIVDLKNLQGPAGPAGPAGADGAPGTGMTYVDAYGAVGDGTTSDTTAFSDAFTALGVTGGVVRLNPAKKYRVGNLTIPTGVTVQGFERSLDASLNNVDWTFSDLGAALLCEPGTTISVATGGMIRGCLLYPYGMDINAQTHSSGWADTAITFTGLGAAAVNNIIIGFNYGIYSAGQSRVRMEWNAIDCNNAIYMTGSYDNSHIMDNHCWPYLTSGVYWNSGADYASRDRTMLYRTGKGLYMGTGSDGTFLDNNMFYGYLIGIHTYEAGAMMWGSNFVDHPFGSARVGNIGVHIDSGTDNSNLGDLIIFSVRTGLQVGLTNSAATVSFGNVHCDTIDENAVYLTNGNVAMSRLVAQTVGSYAINAAGATDLRLRVGSYDFKSVSAAEPIAVFPGATSRDIDIGPGTYDGAAGTQLMGTYQRTMQSIASAATIYLPTVGEFFNLTGTTTVTSIAGGYGDRRIVLRCASTVTITTGGNIALTSPFVSPSAGSTIELYFDGVTGFWREIGRNISPTSVLLNQNGLAMRDTDASHATTINLNSNLSANRTLSITTGDADRTLDLTALLGPWITTYTPTVTAGTGSFGSASAALRYRTVGKTTEFLATITITTVGSAGLYTNVTLPFTAGGGGAHVSTGIELALTGLRCEGYIASGTSTLVIRRDGAFIGANGYVIAVSGDLETT